MKKTVYLVISIILFIFASSCAGYKPIYTAEFDFEIADYSIINDKKIGKLIAKNESAYQYLSDSIQGFYLNPELKNIFNKNGFFCYTDIKYLSGIAILNVFSKV